MQKTLGGQRLGSGNKMNVDLHPYERSTHDLGYIWRSSTAAGTLVPFCAKPMMPGDTFDVNLDTIVMTHPTIGPLFGSYKIQLDMFFCPVRLYQAQLHNNKFGIGMKMENVKLPTMTLMATRTDADDTPDINTAQINPSCIHHYLGIAGVGMLTGAETQFARTFNAVKLLAYWDTVKNYYCNKQEEIGAVIHNQRQALVQTIDSIDLDSSTIGHGAGASGFNDTNETSRINIAYTGTRPVNTQIIFFTSQGPINFPDLTTGPFSEGPGTISRAYNHLKWGSITIFYWEYQTVSQLGDVAPTVVTFPLANIDEMREFILSSATSGPAAVNINGFGQPPYQYVLDVTGGLTNMNQTQEGLALKTYQSDQYNNWLNTEWIDGTGGISEITAIDTSAGNFTLDNLNLKKKVYMLLNRIMVSGGSYQDWIEAAYDHSGPWRAENPIYVGGLSKELIFQEVVSNSQSSSQTGTQPLGTLAGKGVMAKKHKGGRIHVKADEHGYLLGIFSLTPRIDYSQGNSWDSHILTMDDWHKPGLDGIGFQELITEQMAWWDTTFPGSPATQWVTKSAGKQPAWINYMTSVNETHGNFAISTNEMFMTLNRRYEIDDQSFVGIKDLTTYIDPAKFNNIFAQTSLDAQNFWVQIAVDITARRKMSAKLMPTV